MQCLTNIEHNKIPNHVIKRYLTLYPYIGRNDDMLATIEKDAEALIMHTVKEDSFYFVKLFNIELSDARFRAILTKDIQPKTKDERFLSHVKQAFIKIHEDAESFELITNEIRDLIKFLYKDIEPDQALHFSKMENVRKKKSIDLLTSSFKSKQEALDALVERYNEVIKKLDFEVSFVITNFYIDFINLKPFVKHNEEIGLMMAYVLLLTSHYESYHLSSFFEKIYKQRTLFIKYQKDASHNWAEGLANVMHLHTFLLDIALESYKETSEMLRNYRFDHAHNKSDYIENTINKLEEVFTKEQIRQEHPTVSDSTINRTLKRLRDENKIRPLGKGRSAKWMKLYKTPKKQSFAEQLNLKL